MPERDDIISMKKLHERLEETLARVTHTKQPMYVYVPEHRGVAIVELEEYRELERLAEKGLIAEVVEEAVRTDAAGDAVSWEVINEELKRDIEERKRGEKG